ncbi:MAG TPA: LysR family transcriptional regulator [Gaiellaceae bacterium]|jgi:DNA-binding transcriptional LysR family regulator|nr:LysR family transcriptional regulator [Gaiellaceae bacterium]
MTDVAIPSHDLWPGVELRHFAALDAVETEGSFGRAAARLGYTQSAISQQIATLERIVGEQLIERPGGPRPVALTEAGRLMHRHARAIVARLQAAQADLSALAAGESGTLHVGIFQSVGARILPEVMRRFRRAWPNVEVELREAHDDRELADLVERGILDLTFVQLPLENPWLETMVLLSDDYVLVTAAGAPFPAPGRTPTLREIAEQPLIGYRNCRATELVAEQLRATGREPRFVFRSDENGAVQGLAGAGIGAAIMARLAVDPNDETVRITNLSPRVARRQIGIARHKDRYHSAAARAFVATALEVGAESTAEPAAA